MAMRCVNLDWLEVCCLESLSAPRDVFYYEAAGWSVDVRPYGTRVYRQMFTLIAPNGERILEVRRDPASQGITGIHAQNMCHIRLCNRSCYFDNAASFLEDFLERHGYYNVRISRVDICLDFVRFDFGDDPAAFVRRYFKHRYAKINQGRICSHGEDTWNGQDWNSLSWGSKTSSVTTKLYDKTMELYDVKLDAYKKPYIREAWFKCGLIDDIQRCTKNGESVRVWRVEFSLTSSQKNWIKICLDGKDDKPQSLKNTLSVYDSREKILVMFASLARHYFHFKKYEEGKRKDRCDDKVLFNFEECETVYKLGKDDTALGSGQNYKSVFNRLLSKLKAYQMSHSLPEIHKACDVLIASITEENYRSDLANPFDRGELEFFKKLIFVRTSQPNLEYNVAVEEVKRLLNISERTLPRQS